MKLWTEKDEKLKTTIYRADFTCRNKRYKLKAYSAKERDERIIRIKSNALQAKAGIKPNTPPVTLGELVEEHIKDFNYEVEYYRRAKVILELFRDQTGTEKPVEQITTADIRTYIRHRRSMNPKLANSSVNKELTYLSKLFSTAHEYFNDLSEFTGPKLPWYAESTKRKDRVIYPEESAKLLAYLRDPTIHAGEKPDSPQIRGDYADMLEIALGTAARWGEVAQIEWTMVSLPAKEIVLPRRITKTDEPRVLPLNSRLLEILTERKKQAWTKWVFPRKDGLSYRKYYYDRLRAICKKIGLPFGREEGFVLHTSRHTSVSALIENGVDIATVQAISGHKSRTIALHYAHANKKKLHDAVESLVQIPSSEKQNDSSKPITAADSTSSR